MRRHRRGLTLQPPGQQGHQLQGSVLAACSWQKLYGERFARVPRHSGRTVVEQTAPAQAPQHAPGDGDAAA